MFHLIFSVLFEVELCVLHLLSLFCLKYSCVCLSVFFSLLFEVQLSVFHRLFLSFVLRYDCVYHLLFLSFV